MYFSDYLKQFANENTPKGDLARDFITSKSKAKTYFGVLRSMQKYDACDIAIDTLNEIYGEYQRRK